MDNNNLELEESRVLDEIVITNSEAKARKKVNVSSKEKEFVLKIAVDMKTIFEKNNYSGKYLANYEIILKPKNKIAETNILASTSSEFDTKLKEVVQKNRKIFDKKTVGRFVFKVRIE